METERKALGRELREVGIERVEEEEEERDFGEKKSLGLREIREAEAEVAEHAIWEEEQ